MGDQKLDMAQQGRIFQGPLVESRRDIPNLKQIKRPGTMATAGKVGTAGLTKYLNRGDFPIAGHEPLTEMQRKAEMLAFASLLDKVQYSSPFTPFFTASAGLCLGKASCSLPESTFLLVLLTSSKMMSPSAVTPGLLL